MAVQPCGHYVPWDLLCGPEAQFSQQTPSSLRLGEHQPEKGLDSSQVEQKEEETVQKITVVLLQKSYSPWTIKRT